jgi:hypothetical protein
MRSLPYQGLFRDFRVCPHCGKRFTTDRKTKHRQALFLIGAAVSLAFTIALYRRGTVWLAPTLIGYAILGLVFYRGNRRMLFGPNSRANDRTERS